MVLVGRPTNRALTTSTTVKQAIASCVKRTAADVAGQVAKARKGTRELPQRVVACVSLP